MTIDPLEQVLRAKLNLPETDEQDDPETDQSPLALNDSDSLAALINSKLGITTNNSEL